MIGGLHARCLGVQGGHLRHAGVHNGAQPAPGPLLQQGWPRAAGVQPHTGGSGLDSRLQQPLLCSCVQRVTRDGACLPGTAEMKVPLLGRTVQSSSSARRSTRSPRSATICAIACAPAVPSTCGRRPRPRQAAPRPRSATRKALMHPRHCCQPALDQRQRSQPTHRAQMGCSSGGLRPCACAGGPLHLQDGSIQRRAAAQGLHGRKRVCHLAHGGQELGLVCVRPRQLPQARPHAVPARSQRPEDQLSGPRICSTPSPVAGHARRMHRCGTTKRAAP